VGQSSSAAAAVHESLESRLLFAGTPLNVDISKLAGNEAEPCITIDKAHPNRLFATSKITPELGLLASYSLDGGSTWKTRVVADGTDNLPKAATDPYATYDSNGNIFFTYLSTNWLVTVTLSTDGGKSFKKIASFSGSVDQPTVVADGKSVWVSWFEGNKVVAAGAKVTGLGRVGAFSQENVMDSHKGNYGDIAIGPKGQVMVAYQTPTVGEVKDTAVYVAVNPDGLGPAPFNPSVLVTASNVEGDDDIPAQYTRFTDAEAGLAWDRTGGPHTGRVYMVYADEMPDESNDHDIFLRWSEDDGQTWSDRVRVNDDATANTQFLPRIAIDQTTGNLAISWYDCRNDLGQRAAGDTNSVANDDAQYWMTFVSPNASNGVTVGNNFRVSTGTSNAQAANNRVGYGDYSGLDFHAGIAYPLWADNSNSAGGNPEGPLHGFDLYTAKVAYAAPSPFAATAVTAPATTTTTSTTTTKKQTSDLLA
jgi:hypothetical protein